MQSYFILPIHNKQDLLLDVLTGIVNSCSHDFHIIAIVDGCNDNSEAVLRDFIASYKIHKSSTVVIMPDVHEVTSLNYGLTKLRLMDLNANDLVFTVQDDVILQENNIDTKFDYLFSQEQNLGYVSMRLGCDLVFDHNNKIICETNLVESEFGHWKPLGLTHYQALPHNSFVKKQIAIRSPTCVQWKRYHEVGFYDPRLSPCGYDCHDFSIRMLINGYQNGVYTMKYHSDLSWGGTRTNKNKVNSNLDFIYRDNNNYIYNKYYKFIK